MPSCWPPPGPARPVKVVALRASSEASDRRSGWKQRGFRLAPAGMLWVAWPKKASGVATDLSFDVVQKIGLNAGMVDTKICAVDDVWSGLRFVFRLKDRARMSEL